MTFITRRTALGSRDVGLPRPTRSGLRVVNGTSNSYNRSSSFSAYAAYATLSYDAVFYTPTGSFSVAA